MSYKISLCGFFILSLAFNPCLGDQVNMRTIEITLGSKSLKVELEENNATQELIQLLTREPLEVSTRNYGGFEKILTLPHSLPTADRQIRSNAGDVLLYNGNQMVIFYDHNSWSYTPLGKVVEANEKDLEKILSGNETKATISLIKK